MKAKKIGTENFRSRSDAARELLLNTNMSDSAIAKQVGMTPQTVYAVKYKMIMKGYFAK